MSTLTHMTIVEMLSDEPSVDHVIPMLTKASISIKIHKHMFVFVPHEPFSRFLFLFCLIFVAGLTLI